MNIGIIGLGIVGKTIYDVMSQYHKISFHDVKYEQSKIENVIDSQIVFICVPTPSNKNNECDLSIIDDVMDKLHKLNYLGIICIKSTIVPNTTHNYIKQYNNTNICFCPEFLKERSSHEDFKNSKIIIIGTNDDNIFANISQFFSPICNQFKKVDPTEAEITKYFLNVYNTYRILFANAFYEVCLHENINYNNIINNLSEKNEIDGKYLKCDESIRGPSGPCLIKDTLAFNEYVKTIKNNNVINNITMFSSIIKDMLLYPTNNK